MRILVTGGAGFIGRRLIEIMVDRGYKPVCFDLIETSLCESIVRDITDRAAVFAAVQSVEAVLHLAAEANINDARKNPAHCVAVNVGGTHNFIEACLHYGVPLHFVSTCCVYGNSSDHPSNEHSTCVPTEIYAVTKLLSEYTIKEYAERGLRYNILRYGTTYGPGLRGALAIYIFLNQALIDAPATIDGSGEQTRCYIYVDDVVAGTLAVLEKGVINKTINFSTSEELSVLQTVEIIREETGSTNKALEFYPDRPGQIMKEQIDIDYAWKLLGWWPKVDFREGVRRTLEWYKEHVRV